MKLLKNFNKISSQKRFSAAATSYLKGPHLELQHNTTLNDLLINTTEQNPDKAAGLFS